MHVLVGSCSCPLNNSLVDRTRSRGETVTQRPPASAVHWRNVGTTLRHCTADAGKRWYTILQCKTKREYLLTLQVSRYFILVLQRRFVNHARPIKATYPLKKHVSLYNEPYTVRAVPERLYTSQNRKWMAISQLACSEVSFEINTIIFLHFLLSYTTNIKYQI